MNLQQGRTGPRPVESGTRMLDALAANGPLTWLAANLAVAGAYFALGLVVSRFFAAYGLFPAPIWLPASVAVVAAMIGGWRLLPGIFLGSFLANDVLFAPPLHVTTIISATNALGPVIGALILRRLCAPERLFTTFRGAVAFLVATTLVAPAISGAGGALALAIGKPFVAADAASVWLRWLLTDGGGTLYLAPAVLMWLGHAGAAPVAADAPPSRASAPAIWALVAGAGALLFFLPQIPLIGSIRALVPFLFVVPLSWIALRMSLRSAYTLVSLFAIMATAGAVAGVGPFQHSDLANPLQLVGLLVVVLAMNVLTVVALACERQDAEAARVAKSMLLARTSHELRTPLNAVIGFSSLIDRQALGPLANEKYLEYARIIQSSGEHLLALINDLIDLSKIDAGRYELDEAPVAIAATLAEATALIELQAVAGSVEVEIASAGDGIVVHADRQALWQVLVNILSNAVKFTRAGGRVRIDAMLGPQGGLEIAVADTGVGIAPEDLGRLGRPFERARNGTGDAAEGSGLGLAIARALVDLHGGTLVLRSTLGKGTTVTITLPAHRTVAGSGAVVAFPGGTAARA